MIGDFIIVSEVNSNSEATETEELEDSRTDEQYNARPRNHQKSIVCTNTDQQSIMMSVIKTHAHLLLTQANIQENLKAFGN